MILVDTSVWVDHLRTNDNTLVSLLDSAEVMMHPAVLGEISLGNLSRRVALLSLLGALPAATVADESEVSRLVESVPLHGRGIGYVDACLLASARLSGVRLWTRDRRLRLVAAEVAVAADLP